MPLHQKYQAPGEILIPGLEQKKVLSETGTCAVCQKVMKGSKNDEDMSKDTSQPAE